MRNVSWNLASLAVTVSAALIPGPATGQILIP